MTKKTILLTGATGYIGRMLLKDIVHTCKWDIGCLILPVRNIEKAESIFKEELKVPEVDVMFCKGMVRDWNSKNIPQSIDYIIHCACPTKSKEMLYKPVEVADSIVQGTRNILELAVQKQVESMVYLSSMEVYGDIDCNDGRYVSEKELGNIDIDSSRSCYPLGKRMAEHYCHIFHKEYHVPVKIARLSQAFGWGVPLDDSRIFAQIARAVMEDRDIILHTKGLSMGNYCEITDTIKAIWMILKEGKNGEAYNIVNEANTMRIRDMAQLVAERIAHGRIQVRYDIREKNIYGYAAETGLRLSSTKLKALGWAPSKAIEEMYRDVIRWYDQNNPRDVEAVNFSVSMDEKSFR